MHSERLQKNKIIFFAAIFYVFILDFTNVFSINKKIMSGIIRTPLLYLKQSRFQNFFHFAALRRKSAIVNI